MREPPSRSAVASRSSNTGNDCSVTVGLRSAGDAQNACGTGMPFGVEHAHIAQIRARHALIHRVRHAVSTSGMPPGASIAMPCA